MSLTAHPLPSGLVLAAAGGDVEIGPLLLGLFGGLALFLYGMSLMADALRAIAGDRMRGVLARLTSNRVAGAVTGAVVTAAIQSSSVTTVLVVGFISAGLMTVTQSVGVIMGANIGSTVTAQIIAFQISEAALAMVAVGFTVHALARRRRTKDYGRALLGLGLVFLGMTIMGDAMRPLRSYEPFLELTTRLEAPLLGILVGAVVTALVQSSAATAGVVIVLAAQGLLSLEAGIALVFGANIGTCVTAVLAAIGRSREAMRAAAVHVLFNVIGVLLWLPLIHLLSELVRAISPAGDTPREIANAHTIFNVANTVVFLPFARVFAHLVTRLLPDRPPEQKAVGVKYLNDELLSTPGLALAQTRLEILHMGNRTRRMLEDILPAVLDGTREEIDDVARQDDAIDVLHGRIITYLGRVSRQRLTDEQTADLVHLMEATNDLENIGDLIETNLAAIARHRLDLGVTISDETRKVISDFHAELLRAFDGALLAVTQRNVEAAQVVTGMKADINRMAEAAAAHGVDRLLAPEPHRLPTYRIETDILQNLKRVYYFAKRMARVVVSANGNG